MFQESYKDSNFWIDSEFEISAQPVIKATLYKII